MKHSIIIITKSAVFYLHLLILLLIVSLLIPSELLNKHLKESIKYHNSIKSEQGDIYDVSADSTELNIIKNNDKSQLLKSLLVTRAYRNFASQDFIAMAEDTIINQKPANYDYNRYWHGYQIFWRPLLLIMNTYYIKIFCLFLYVILLIYEVRLCIKNEQRALGIGIFLMNIIHIVPLGFSSLEFIPIFFIQAIFCILIIKKPENANKYFILSGISTAFFDFLTAETLTCTTLLVIYLALNKSNFKLKNIFTKGILWLIGYTLTFTYKWGLSTLIYHKNYFKIACDKYNTHQLPVPKIFGIKFNISFLFRNTFSFNTAFYLYIGVTTLILLFVYFFRTRESSCKYILILITTGLIPYIRFYIMHAHSAGYSYFTYRAQLIVVLISTLIISETIFFKKKGRLINAKNN